MNPHALTVGDRALRRVCRMNFHDRFRFELLELCEVGEGGVDAVAAVGKQQRQRKALVERVRRRSLDGLTIVGQLRAMLHQLFFVHFDASGRRFELTIRERNVRFARPIEQ